VRWCGGKGKLAGWLLPLIPEGGRPYCEPYTGAAAVLFARAPAPVEVLNDLDERIITLFRVLQDRDKFAELEHRLRYTPYARAEFRRALEILATPDEHDDVARAWAFFVAQNQGFSGTGQGESNWGRTFRPARGMADTVSDWHGRLSLLRFWHRRLMRVQIDCIDALECIRYWDNPDAVFYVDPPYVPDTRTSREVYTHEPDAAHHEELVEVLLSVQGAAVLSGYRSELYEPLEAAGWERRERRTSAHAAGRVRSAPQLRGKGAATTAVPRTESVWRNPKAVELTQGGRLF
jgi:DNA adenine methylase